MGHVYNTIYFRYLKIARETWITLERVDEPGVIYAEGGPTTLWFDARTDKAIALPERVRALLT